MEIPFDLIGMIFLLKDLMKLSLWSNTVNFSVSYVLEMIIIYIFLLWVQELLYLYTYMSLKVCLIFVLYL